MMIKFFRNIRKDFLSEGKTSKYFKYAIGEIILVVVGILIALQVNNWNEIRKDRVKEKEILNEIHSDFKNNLEEFYPVKQNQINTFNSGNIVFRNISKLHIVTSRDSVFKHVTNMFGGYPYHPSNGVIESLISSGEVNLIRNDTLRRLLVSWKDVLNDYSEEVVFDRNLWTNMIEPYVIKNGDFLNLASDKNKRLLLDTVFINMLVRKQFFQRNIVRAISGENGLEKHLKEIVRLSEVK
ncbi:DUF6090 family protein [Sabulilitoribacter multivorans]|uniref:DUF6090 family protein n=1 Tax=Flaviramulus multivorans TaxID=1304750 RepID=A0ABS9IMF8_9FLAO|nr:DUF6090 family protein [Flaviramulus multivorans]MCF7561797.1 DUF6090 family protein [Flaviramulus multivorans]